MVCNAISCALVQFLHRTHFLHTIDHISLKRLVRIMHFKCHLFLLPQTKDISMWTGKIHTSEKKKRNKSHLTGTFQWAKNIYPCTHGWPENHPRVQNPALLCAAAGNRLRDAAAGLCCFCSGHPWRRETEHGECMDTSNV